MYTSFSVNLHHFTVTKPKFRSKLPKFRSEKPKFRSECNEISFFEFKNPFRSELPKFSEISPGIPFPPYGGIRSKNEKENPGFLRATVIASVSAPHPDRPGAHAKPSAHRPPFKPLLRHSGGAWSARRGPANLRWASAAGRRAAASVLASARRLCRYAPNRGPPGLLSRPPPSQPVAV